MLAKSRLREIVKTHFPYLQGVLERTEIVRRGRDEPPSITVDRNGKVTIAVPAHASSLTAHIALIGLFQVAMGHVWRGADDPAFHAASDLLITTMLSERRGRNYGLAKTAEEMRYAVLRALRQAGLSREKAEALMQMVSERKSAEEIATFLKLHANLDGKRYLRSGATFQWSVQCPKSERMKRYLRAKQQVEEEARKYGAKPGEYVSDVAATGGRRNWRDVIAAFMRRISYRNTSYSRPQKRLLYRDIVMPGYTRGRAKLAVILDTSGSIRDEMLSQFLCEVLRMMKANDVEGYLITADVKVHDVMKLSDVKSAMSMSGRGGTSFVEALEKAEQLRVDGIIYFTDLYGRFPDWEPKTPAIWAVPEEGSDENPPFGKVVRV
ncbi:MAG: hypothetical protein PWP76_429 [Candidatus Diapherotrites archaeon]|nr:hypothetical protein [Candidatus Diapherotrites archaeon]MDN5367124.1 hypothetical protein [Candidatus Diapherotrites archaeon]